MGKQYISKNNSRNMKILIALALLFAVAVATPTTTTCEQKNEILMDALVRLAKKDNPQVDCSTCYDDILAAVADCFFSGTWLQCIQDILGGANPCIDCVCEVITDSFSPTFLHPACVRILPMFCIIPNESITFFFHLTLNLAIKCGEYFVNSSNPSPISSPTFNCFIMDKAVTVLWPRNAVCLLVSSNTWISITFFKPTYVGVVVVWRIPNPPITVIVHFPC